MSTFVPGGNSGVLLKSNTPFIWAQADSFGFIREFLNKLIVSSAWGNRRSHSVIGNCGLHVASPLKKWFFKVCIAASAALRLCWCGGTNWYCPPYTLIVACNSFGHSLSKINNFYLLFVILIFHNNFKKLSPIDSLGDV